MVVAYTGASAGSAIVRRSSRESAATTTPRASATSTRPASGRALPMAASLRRAIASCGVAGRITWELAGNTVVTLRCGGGHRKRRHEGAPHSLGIARTQSIALLAWHRERSVDVERSRILVTGAMGRVAAQLLPALEERWQLRLLDRTAGDGD